MKITLTFDLSNPLDHEKYQEAIQGEGALMVIEATVCKIVDIMTAPTTTTDAKAALQAVLSTMKETCQEWNINYYGPHDDDPTSSFSALPKQELYHHAQR